MSIISRLGNAKISRAILLAGAVTLSAAEFSDIPNPAYAQELKGRHDAKTEKMELVFTGPNYDIGKYKPASEFLGLDIKVEPVPTKLYRNDGYVKSAVEKLLATAKETGFAIKDRDKFLKKFGNAGGACYRYSQHVNGAEYRIAHVFFEPMNPVFDVYFSAHENMHAADYLGFPEVDEKLVKRFLRKGFMIRFPDFDDEEKACIVGILRVMEHDMHVEGLFSLPKLENRYRKLQNYRIN